MLPAVVDLMVIPVSSAVIPPVPVVMVVVVTGTANECHND